MTIRTKIVTWSLVGVIVIGGIVSAIVFWPALSSFVVNLFNPQQTDIDNGPSTYTANPQLYEQAVKAAATGGPEAGQKVLDAELAKTDNKPTRSAIYSQKAALASTGKASSKSEALAFAYQAEAENPDYATALMIADMEYLGGNKSKALTYYKLYLERLTDEAIEMNPGDKEYYEKRVKELEAEL